MIPNRRPPGRQCKSPDAFIGALDYGPTFRVLGKLVKRRKRPCRPASDGTYGISAPCRRCLSSVAWPHPGVRLPSNPRSGVGNRCERARPPPLRRHGPRDGREGGVKPPSLTGTGILVGPDDRRGISSTTADDHGGSHDRQEISSHKRACQESVPARTHRHASKRYDSVHSSRRYTKGVKE